MEASRPFGRATPRSGGGLRPDVEVHVWHLDRPGFPATDPYVLRWWTCALGPTAITDLLRMIRAAAAGPAVVPRPHALDALMTAGLVVGLGRRVVVPVPIRPVGPPHDRRIPAHLRRQHAADLERAVPA